MVVYHTTMATEVILNDYPDWVDAQLVLTRVELTHQVAHLEGMPNRFEHL